MARDNKGFACHKHTSMVSYESHHIWPVAYHGPDTPENRVKVCCNAHSDIHYLMERLLRSKPVEWREYGMMIRWYAWQGYKAVTMYAEELSS